MHAANKTISKVISLWLEETLLHSTARRRNNHNLQPRLNSYFTYQTPDSAEKFTETKQNKGLGCDEIYGYSNLINWEQWSSYIKDLFNSFVREQYMQFISPGIVHAWVGQKLLKNYIFKSFYDVQKLRSGHHSNEYKCNTETTPL
jgi:hypothetical protein